MIITTFSGEEGLDLFPEFSNMYDNNGNGRDSPDNRSKMIPRMDLEGNQIEDEESERNRNGMEFDAPDEDQPMFAGTASFD